MTPKLVLKTDSKWNNNNDNNNNNNRYLSAPLFMWAQTAYNENIKLDQHTGNTL